jgi:hypothetical protein
MGRTPSPILSLFPSAADGNRNGRKLIAFGWYGGKFSHLQWLLKLLPACHHYCEPFAGSAAVLLNRDPSPVEKKCHSVKQARAEALWMNY